eukprot:g91.t1
MVPQRSLRALGSFLLLHSGPSFFVAASSWFASSTSDDGAAKTGAGDKGRVKAFYRSRSPSPDPAGAVSGPGDAKKSEDIVSPRSESSATQTWPLFEGKVEPKMAEDGADEGGFVEVGEENNKVSDGTTGGTSSTTAAQTSAAPSTGFFTGYFFGGGSSSTSAPGSGHASPAHPHQGPARLFATHEDTPAWHKKLFEKTDVFDESHAEQFLAASTEESCLEANLYPNVDFFHLLHAKAFNWHGLLWKLPKIGFKIRRVPDIRGAHQYPSTPGEAVTTEDACRFERNKNVNQMYEYVSGIRMYSLKINAKVDVEFFVESPEAFNEIEEAAWRLWDRRSRQFRAGGSSCPWGALQTILSGDGASDFSSEGGAGGAPIADQEDVEMQAVDGDEPGGLATCVAPSAARASPRHNFHFLSPAEATAALVSLTATKSAYSTEQGYSIDAKKALNGLNPTEQGLLGFFRKASKKHSRRIDPETAELIHRASESELERSRGDAYVDAVHSKFGAASRSIRIAQFQIKFSSATDYPYFDVSPDVRVEFDEVDMSPVRFARDMKASLAANLLIWSHHLIEQQISAFVRQRIGPCVEGGEKTVQSYGPSLVQMGVACGCCARGGRGRDREQDDALTTLKV